MNRDNAAAALAIVALLVVAWYLTTPDSESDIDSPDGDGISVDTLWASTIGSVGALMSGQTVGTQGINLIKQYEGCKLASYYDVNGYSIGYGHHQATEGQTCTQAQADSWLYDDASAAASTVLSYCRVALTQSQLDALTDWIYEMGASKVKNATLWSVLNGGNYEGVPAQLVRWCNVSGSPNANVLARRQAECDLWNGSAS